MSLLEGRVADAASLTVSAVVQARDLSSSTVAGTTVLAAKHVGLVNTAHVESMC